MTTTIHERYLGFFEFFREYDRDVLGEEEQDDPDYKPSWRRGLKKARALGGTWNLLKLPWAIPNVIAYEDTGDARAESVFWKGHVLINKLKDKFKLLPSGHSRVDRIRAHEMAHGPAGEVFPELADEGRTKEGGLKHVPEDVDDIMSPRTSSVFHAPDPRGIVDTYLKYVEEGKIKRTYEGFFL